MKALPLLSWAVVCLGLAACQTIAPIATREPQFTLPPPPPMAPVSSHGPLKPLRLPELDFSLLSADDFIPPGATIIWPDPRYTVPLHLTPRETFPSTAESTAPDGTAVVGSRSEKAYGGLRHWLRLFRQGDSIARSLLQTDKSLETVWSHDSLALAISHFVGNNRAEVLVVRIRDDRQTHPVDTLRALAPYFPPVLLESPRFEIAYRWSNGPVLVVRGMGRFPAEPYDTFGYEIAIDATQPDNPGQMHFIRGYIDEGRMRSSGGQQQQ